MNFKVTTIGLLGTLFIAHATYSQQEYKPINSLEIIREGIKLNDEEKYAEAIAEYKKITRNDSLFQIAAMELVITYSADKKDSLALALCNELLKQTDENTPEVLLLKANALDNLKRIKEAEEVYKFGTKTYPLNNKFWHELGVSNFRRENYYEAHQCFVKSIKLNPMYAASHFQMGNLAIKQNKLVAAMLAWQYYLVCDNSSKRASTIISAIEEVAKLEVKDADKIIEIAELKESDDFSELESIFRSKIALSDKYKSKTDLNYDLVKQMQLITENVGKYKDVKGFYNSFYGTFFTAVWDKKYFEPYIYNAFAGLKNEDINKWVSKNSKQLEQFGDWAYDYVCTKEAVYPELLNGTEKNVPHWFYRNMIAGAGEKTAQGKYIGYWNFYYEDGIKKSEGNFVDGLKEGLWKAYNDNGKIKTEIIYSKGIQTHYKDFFENTNPKTDYYVKNDILEGKAITYHSNGKPSADYDYVNNKIFGNENKFYKNGAKQYAVTNKNGNIEGDVIEYFDNGKISQKCTFANGLREGKAIYYYNNAKNTIQSEGQYTKGKATGAWKMYHKNERISDEGTFNNDGEKEGIWKLYHSNGNLSEESNYSDGKYNGLVKIFTIEGKPWEDFTYKKNKITEIKSYKENGEVLGVHQLEGKSNVITLYYPNGVKRREGLYKNGEAQGLWKNYNLYGVLTEENNYKDNELDGATIEYYGNGKRKSETFYKNGSQNAYYKLYYVNGNLRREGYMVNGNEQGTWKYYYIDGKMEDVKYFNEGEVQSWQENYDVRGKLINEELYKLTCIDKIIFYDTLGNIKQNIDLPGGNGVISEKYENGKIAFQREFAFDLPQGKSNVYYPDGSVLSEIEYQAGKAVGIQKAYDPFGKLYIETPYFNGKTNGKKIDYHFNGKKKSEFNYVDNDTEGECLTYYENGKLFRKLNYINDKVEGESFLYDELGELVYVRKYINDILIGYMYNDAKGQLSPLKKLESGDTKLIAYFSNGKKSIEANYTNGELNGVRTYYCSNGNVAEVENYVYDYQHGETKSFYCNGNPKTIENYVYGIEQGVFKYYYENGKLQKESTYLNGKEHGLTKYYNEQGVLVKSIQYYDGFPITMK